MMPTSAVQPARLAALLLLMTPLLVAGVCSGEDEPQTDPCQELCQRLADCKLCLLDANKQCRTLQGCTDYCNGKASLRASVPCIKQVKNCDKTQINACMATKKDGGVPPKDTGAVKKDGGGKSYKGTGKCRLELYDLACQVTHKNTDGTTSTVSSTCPFGYDYLTNTLYYFNGELKLNRFYGTLLEKPLSDHEFKGDMEIVFDHHNDLLVTWKQVVDSYYTDMNGVKKHTAKREVRGGNRVTTTTRVEDNGKSLSIRTEHKGASVCNYLVLLKADWGEDKSRGYSSSSLTQHSCTSKTRLKLDCFFTLQ